MVRNSDMTASHTNSSLTCFRRCPREYMYRYVMLRRSKERSAPLEFGSMWHRCMDQWWSRPEGSWSALRAAIDAARNCVADQWDRIRVEEMLYGYTTMWESYPYELIECELRFDEGGRAGSIDKLIRSSYGLQIVEHKTSSMDIGAGSAYWETILSTDSQVSTYISAARKIGYQVESCLYDVVRKVKMDPLKATPDADRKYTKATRNTPSRLYAGQRELDETPDEYRQRVRDEISSRPAYYYSRQTIVRTCRDIDEHERDTTETIHMHEFSRRTGMYPRYTNSCRRYNTMCDYHHVCSGIASIDDDAIYRTAATAHEELA